MSWPVAKISDEISMFVEPEGVWLRGQHGPLFPHRLRPRDATSRLARLLPTLLPQLVEMGIAVEIGGAFRIGHKAFAGLEAENKIDAFDGVVPWAPFSIEVETTGWPGGDSFRYFYRFYSGRQLVSLERIGSFVKRAENVYRLDAQTFALVEAMDAFNSLPGEAKAGREAFLRFAEVKDLAEGVGAQLDEFLSKERVIVPSKVVLDLIEEAEGRITFAPRFDGAPPGAMLEAFLACNNVEEVYSLDDSRGGRVRVVLDETQQEVLRRMQRVRHLAGAKKAEVLRNPNQVFDGVAGAVEISLGPRVTGIGDFPFVAQPFLQRSSTGIFEGPEPGDRARARFMSGLECRYTDGSVEKVAFSSRDELLAFRQAVDDARQSGCGVVEFKGKSIPLDENLVKGLQELTRQFIPSVKGEGGRESGPRKYLLIYTNENDLEYEEPEGAEGEQLSVALPRSLNRDVLKDHQVEGLQWLARAFRRQRGCLLADDMGLGKTLQVLSFLARIIEDGAIARGSRNPEAAPWDPILIIMPVTLLENEIWVENMQNFFSRAGDVFKPWILLHGSRLRDLRRERPSGKETEIGEAVLNLDMLRQYRVVLTNYETVVNYQHSFAKMKDYWSVVVTDEAQEYKTSSTKISHALKSLAPGFRVACTGTPVETRLMDVWNIFDFLQPGKLGSAAEFTNRYEKPLEGSDEDAAAAVLPQLKQKLQLNRKQGFVLRREKTLLPDLPKKHEHKIDCSLSPTQREWHLDLVSRAKSGGEGNHPFSLLGQLMRVYEHPALIPRYEPLKAKEAIELCPKLSEVIKGLHEIKNRNEKALIFTRSLNMQQILSMTLGEEFNLEVDIINGATPRYGDTKSAQRSRRGIVERFRQSEGFNVIVLSPEVAGVGLTLVEANHVIHYGRWWNPAKEAQATDRVYRIGQTRDVHVYYPIARDPQSAFETFDEKLDKLIQKRRRLASNFLTPMPGEDDLGRELLRDVMEAPAEPAAVKTLTMDDVRLMPWDRFEALVALLEEKRGRKVVLTPCGGDYKADVIAVRGKEMRLIQCKHSIWGSLVNDDALAEAVGAMDIYRARFLRGHSQDVLMRPVVVTNGQFTRQARRAARERGVELVGCNDLPALLEETPCTPAEAVEMEERRMASMRDVQAALRNML